MRHLTEDQKKILEEKLIKSKTRLEEDLRSFAQKDPEMPEDWDSKFVKMDPGLQTEDELADEVEEYGNELGVEYSLEDQLRDVDGALERMKNGTYGLCEKCGKEITFERLQAVPEARTCTACSRLKSE